MNERKLILLSLVLSLAGVGFMYFESGRTGPQTPTGELEDYVNTYVEVSGIVCREHVSDGHHFLAVAGSHEVEVTLFYGIASKMDVVPQLGDWISVRGELTEVDDRYRRHHWPRHAVTPSSPDDVTRVSPDIDILRHTNAYAIRNAGQVYSFDEQVSCVEGDMCTVGNVRFRHEGGYAIGDHVCGAVIICDLDGEAVGIPLTVEHVEASPVGPSEVVEVGRPYYVSGTVRSVRVYYTGCLVELCDEQGTVHVFVPRVIDAFPRDEMSARGVYRNYYRRYVLYAPAHDCVTVRPVREGVSVSPADVGEKRVIKASVEKVTFKGNHPILLLDDGATLIEAHLYAEERDDLERRGRDPLCLPEGVPALFFLSIDGYGEGVVHASILDVATLADT
jgi:hypothetical protein